MGCLARIICGAGPPFDGLWSILTPSADSPITFSTDPVLQTAAYKPRDDEFLFVLGERMCCARL